jgi:hypothetical protein
MGTYRVHVEHVHSQFVGRQVHRLENLLQCHWSFLFGHTHHGVRLGLQCLLDETQKVFLVHARCCMNMGVHLEWRLENNDVLFKMRPN